jgi:starvation-inducible outer membrane lipoprotein
MDKDMSDMTNNRKISASIYKYWVIQNDCGQVWQLCTNIYVATVWVG